jgi:TRAP-type C4-dicarboxylate transport system substrate-binding protein
MHEWADAVEKAGGGKIEMIVHDGGSLLSADEAYRGTQTGVCDAAYYVVNKMDGFLLNDIVSLPFMGYPDQDQTIKIWEQLVDEFPAMRDEFVGTYPYKFMMMPPTHIHMKDKLIKTPAEAKGEKLFTAEDSLTRSISAAGATPVDIDIADMYTSVERGVVDGVVNHIAVLQVFGTLELLKTHTVFGEGGISMNPMGIVWNLDIWNSYPDEIKMILTDNAQVWYDAFYGADQGFQQVCWGLADEWGHTTYRLTDAELQQWKDLVQEPIHEKWIEECASKGLPGQEVYDRALELAAK